MNHKQTERKINLLYYLFNVAKSSIYVSSWSRDVVNLECSVKNVYFRYFSDESKTCGFFERICRIVVNFFRRKYFADESFVEICKISLCQEKGKHSCFNLSNFLLQIFLILRMLGKQECTGCNWRRLQMLSS